MKSIPLWTSASLCFEAENSQQEQSESSKSKRYAALIAGQDGSKEWITVIATICADGTSLSPALIYKASSGNLQDTWLNDFKPQEHSCHFASSPNGWTSDELGYSWLAGLFETETASKARRCYRLLFVDGHGSHLNLNFLNCVRSIRSSLRSIRLTPPTNYSL